MASGTGTSAGTDTGRLAMVVHPGSGHKGLWPHWPHWPVRGWAGWPVGRFAGGGASRPAWWQVVGAVVACHSGAMDASEQSVAVGCGHGH
jgi:hypothetical protein